jgi:hypothetical protein
MKTSQNSHWYSAFVGKSHGTMEREQRNRPGRLRGKGAHHVERGYELLPRRGDRR